MDNCYKQEKCTMKGSQCCANPKMEMSKGCYTKDIDDFPIAMAYVPWQYWNEQYEIKKALYVGTIFPELNKPFLGMRGGKR